MGAKRVLALTMWVAGLIVATPAPAWTQNVSDETGPTVTQVTFSATSFDTTPGAQNVTMTVAATDDLSGVNYVYVYVKTNATGQPSNQSSFSCYASALVSGTRTNGTFTGTCTIPQYSRSGTWFVYQAYAYDMVGNYNTVYNGGNQLSIAPQLLTITAPSAPPPSTTIVPELVYVDVTPASVDTSNASQTVTITARITSSTGSFYYGYAQLRDPSSNQYVSAYFYSPLYSPSYSNRIAGDGYDGIYRATATLPRYSRAGNWVWTNVQVYDPAYHYSYYYSPTNGSFRYRQTYNGATSAFTDLGSSGPTFTPETLSVLSNPSDTAPPTLVNFQLSPPSIDVSTGAGSITVTVTATDALSGFNYGCFSFLSPNGQQSRGGCFYQPSSSIAMFFPQYSQAGNWSLSYLYLNDNNYNYRYYYANDLAQLGFPTSLQISSGVEVQNVTGYLDGLVTLTAKLTKLGVPSSGKTLSFSVRGIGVGSAVTDGNGIATLENVSIAGTPVGTYVNAIVASFAGDADQVGASGRATLTVTNKLSQTITFGPLADRSLSSSPFAVAATASSGLVVTFAGSGSCSVSGSTVTLTSAGSCTVVASQAGNALYNAAPSVARTFNVLTKADQTITFAAIADRLYGAGAFSIGPTSSSGLAVTVQTSGNCSISGQVVTPGSVGTCQLTASQPGNDSYNAAPDVVRSFAITPASLTITADRDVATSAADHFTKTYDGLAYSGFTVRYSGLVNGDTPAALSGTLSFSGEGVSATQAGGPYTVTPGGLTSSNYTIAFGNGTLDIAQTTLTVRADSNPTTAAVDHFTKTYNGQAYSGFTVRYEGFVNGEGVSVLGGTLTFTGVGTTATAAGGPYAVTPAGLTSGNYAISFGSGAVDIAQAPLTVKADDASAVLNGPMPTFGVTYSGLVAGQTSAVLGGTLNCTSTASTTAAVGSYTITCSGLTSSNYAISYQPGTLAVQYAASNLACYGGPGHLILQPIDADDSSVFKKGSTVPAKFRVCDANGGSIGTTGVVASFRLVQVVSGTVGDVDEAVVSTTPDTVFRWDSVARQWIFNISTKTLSANASYVYLITLNDGTTIRFQYGLR